MYFWHEALDLKKPRTIFRYHLEHYLMLQRLGACGPDAAKRFIQSLARARATLTRIKKQGADVGYILWVLLKAQWIIRIPPDKSHRDFWRKKRDVIELALEGMKELRPYFFSAETILEVERGLSALKGIAPNHVIYEATNW